MEYWSRNGERALLAKTANITDANLYDILHRTRGISPTRALLLERCAEDVLNRKIPWTAWLLNKTTKHPAFFGEPLPE